jgi:hypothetical protein
MLRAARVDEWMRQGESAAWFDEWKKTRNLQPPQLPQLPASWINEAVKKAEPGFKPPNLPGDVAPPLGTGTPPQPPHVILDDIKLIAERDLPQKEVQKTGQVPIKSPIARPPHVILDDIKQIVEGGRTQKEVQNKEEVGRVPIARPPQWSFADLFKNAPPDVQKQLMDLSAELVKMLQPRTVVTSQGTYVVDTVPPDVVIGNILYNLQQSNISPENLYSELIAKLRGEVERLKEQRTKEEEKNLDKAFERVEEQRRREAELGERLDQLKSMRGGQWRVPVLFELPESPFAISPWRWASPKPIELLMPARRREVPA